jgi:hypothetical protein
MMTLGYRPESRESFHGTKKLIAFLLRKDLNPSLHQDKQGILPLSHYTSATMVQLIRQWHHDIEELCLFLMVWGSMARTVMTYSCLCKARALHANTATQSQSIREPQADLSDQRPLNQPEATAVTSV